MKKIISLFSLFMLLLVQWGCESHHDENFKQEQVEGTGQETPLPKAPPEHGGGAGNK